MVATAASAALPPALSSSMPASTAGWPPAATAPFLPDACHTPARSGGCWAPARGGPASAIRAASPAAQANRRRRGMGSPPKAVERVLVAVLTNHRGRPRPLRWGRPSPDQFSQAGGADPAAAGEVEVAAVAHLADQDVFGDIGDALVLV